MVIAGQECLTNVLLLLQAFAIFCGMAIHNTVMYENVNKAMAKQKVALEVRNFFQKLCIFRKYPYPQVPRREFHVSPPSSPEFPIFDH